MYHDYASQAYYVKAHALELINEAAQARQAQEYRLARKPKAVATPKKAYSSVDRVYNINSLVRHDI